MADSPRRPDKSWTPEVDRLLRQLDPSAPVGGRPAPASTRTTRPNAAPSHTTAPTHRPRPLGRRGVPGHPAAAQPNGAGRSAIRTTPIRIPSRAGVWARAALGLVLAAALTQWPYGVCGLSLAAYLAAAAVVVLAGAWTGQRAWRARMGRAHVVAMVILVAGATLATVRVVPRIDAYGGGATWGCPR